MHSSDLPQIWNMTKCLAVAALTAGVGILGSVIFLWLCLPTGVAWFSALNTPLRADIIKPHTTNGEARPPHPSILSYQLGFQVISTLPFTPEP